MYIAALREAAARRGTALPDPLTPEAAFATVRDMPYRRPTVPSESGVIADWCGTCSGKHLLLHRLLAEMGVEVRLLLAGYFVSREALATLGLPVPPGSPMDMLLSAGPIPEVHTYLEVLDGDEPFALDATIPASAARLGLPVNTAYRPGQSMRIAITGAPVWSEAVAPDCLSVEKERRLQDFCGLHRPRREAFIQGLSAWLSQVRG